MTYTVSEMLDLVLFNTGLSGTQLAKQSGLGAYSLNLSKKDNFLTKRNAKKLSDFLGKDWDSPENLRLYQKRKNFVESIPGLRISQVRTLKEVPAIQVVKHLNVGHLRLTRIEAGESKLESWVEYLNLAEILGDDLTTDILIPVKKPKPQPKPKKNYKTVRRSFMTFKNVGGSWATGERIKFERVRVWG